MDGWGAKCNKRSLLLIKLKFFEKLVIPVLGEIQGKSLHRESLLWYDRFGKLEKQKYEDNYYL